MLYFLRSPWWMRNMFPERQWKVKTPEKKLYLSFDDGPTPGVTEFVLDLLKKYDAQATFFCIGNNVKQHPELYQRIINEGHSIGNHSFSHLNGWRTDNAVYIKDVADAAEYIKTRLFRPPYGKLRRFQQYLIKDKMTIVMWSLLSGDFDQSITPQKCRDNVILNGRPGDIIVFHDSIKAYKNLEVSLPATLKYFKEKGFAFDKIPCN